MQAPPHPLTHHTPPPTHLFAPWQRTKSRQPLDTPPPDKELSVVGPLTTLRFGTLAEPRYLDCYRLIDSASKQLSHRMPPPPFPSPRRQIGFFAVRDAAPWVPYGTAAPRCELLLADRRSQQPAEPAAPADPPAAAGRQLGAPLGGGLPQGVHAAGQRPQEVACSHVGNGGGGGAGMEWGRGGETLSLGVQCRIWRFGSQAQPTMSNHSIILPWLLAACQAPKAGGERLIIEHHSHSFFAGSCTICESS